MYSGTYEPDPTDTTGYNNDKIGVSFVTFDSTSGSSGKATPRIFVGVATQGSANLFMSNDAGSTCTSLPKTMVLVRCLTTVWDRDRVGGHKLELDPAQGCLVPC